MGRRRHRPKPLLLTHRSAEDLVSAQLNAVLVGPAIFAVKLCRKPTAGSDIDYGWRCKCQM